MTGAGARTGRVKAWAIKRPSGTLVKDTIALWRDDAWSGMSRTARPGGNESWEKWVRRLKRRGYRAVRVRITEDSE